MASSNGSRLLAGVSSTLTRRRLLALSGASLASSALPGLALAPTTPALASAAFGFDQVRAIASETAGKEYEPLPRVPEAWQTLDHHTLAAIRFKPERALWRHTGLFEMQLFKAAGRYTEVVRVNTVDNGVVRPVLFDPASFEMNSPEARALPLEGAGLAGFRLHFPLNTGALAEEFISFLGASFFSIVGAGQRYGSAARGLAIDTASEDGEEFPRFREFWVERPAAQADSVTICALLDSPSLTGAYRFRARPGPETTVEVDAELFARRDVDKLGLAPLSSMFLKGENSQRDFDDWRPEVHDADGLAFQSGDGEWMWRPLVNRRELAISRFELDAVAGFGLLQRDRRAGSYQDLGRAYERRPSLWVRPATDWGRGRLELVEIPSESHGNDNVVAYWVPETPLEAGDSRRFAYTLTAAGSEEQWPPVGRAVGTHIGSAWMPGAPERLRAVRRFNVDFAGGDLAQLDRHQPVEASVTTSVGEVLSTRVQRNENIRGWRTVFDLNVDERDGPVELRCFLSLRQHTLTETWGYLYTGSE